MNRQTVGGFAWRTYADLRRRVARGGTANSALASLGDPSRSQLADWLDITAERHERYRREHPVPRDRVAAVCVSMRPDMIGDVVANVSRQRDVDVELIFVANSPEFDTVAVEAALAPLGRSVIIDRPPSHTSLGEALNRGFDRTDARYVAKLDDDDMYGPHYLADSLRAHGYAGAGVVGKHSYYARLAASGTTHLRFPANEFRYSGTLAGGTLVIDRERVGDQRFNDVSLGEDREFLTECHRRGVSSFSADRFNFVQLRTGTNTWAISDSAFLEGSCPVMPDEVEHIDR